MDYIIIVAGGKGLRMGTNIPKQFLSICGKPVLMRTMECFKTYNKELKIILVLPKEQHVYWQELCEEYCFVMDYEITDGGITRFHSVQNGLSIIPQDAEGVVGVHDGVRPFVTTDVIARCFETARKEKAVIPVMPVIETLRHIDANGNGVNVQRNDYRMVQTPQTFHIQLLKHAYEQSFKESFTDDASVVESIGQRVTMVEGNKENIKITTPFDVIIAEAMIKKHIAEQ